VRTGSAPQVMAALRNLAIGVLCRAGPVNLAAAPRHHSRNPYRPWPPSASASDEPDFTQEPTEALPGLDRQAGLRRVRLTGVARALGPVDQNTVGHGPGRNPITDTRLDAAVSLLDQEFQHRRLPRLDH
jgi:hypothetical protein